MKNFAQLVDGTVVNIIVADDSFSEEGFIEYTDENPAFIGGDYHQDFFYAEQPYPSWTRDGQGNWIAPKEKPEDAAFYVWDEESLDWVAL